MSGINPKVWADGFGRWHASVPITGSRQRDAMAARKLITAAIDERGERHPDWRVRVTREHVTNHGTVVYGEV